ncbi:hypothetical protein KFL_002910050 [Klebsormidium nitens]|uniref:MYND-type domain-containing protein n=1 Tax=Klebsormidium nitens TaxID=105231 RepID=A0A1Y1ICL3_KLENI|nr:hypothetical protein KFL_002910050 [Klebsormidium nitens]|eukprot:GAQ86467.1 hypothetical protein KFL_002910050 [Klebsormidium nitens]
MPATRPLGCTFFPRLIQELAIYQQGYVVKKLVTQALGQSSLSGSETSENANSASSCAVAGSRTELAHASLSLLVSLSSSKAFALFCQDYEGVSEKLLCCFVENLKLSKRPTVEEDASNTAKYIAQHLPAACLDGLILHARASEMFRQLIRAHKKVLPAVLSLFEDDTIKHLSDEGISQLRQGVTSLVMALAFAKDSQEWMIEQGYIRLLASIQSREGFDASSASDLVKYLKEVKSLKFSRCGRCTAAYYCSKDHQKLHWPTHKKHCFNKGKKQP